MAPKHLTLLFISLLTGLFLHAQNPASFRVCVRDPQADHFTIELTIQNVRYEISDNGVVHAYKTARNFAAAENQAIDYWQQGWGNSLAGHVKRIGSVNLDYWGDAWGAEKAGKIKSIGTIEFDYWPPAWGSKKGMIRSVGNIQFDYWTEGWGEEKQGKIRSIGSVTIDYWGAGWPDKAGRIKSVEGRNDNVEISIPFI